MPGKKKTASLVKKFVTAREAKQLLKESIDQPSVEAFMQNLDGEIRKNSSVGYDSLELASFELSEDWEALSKAEKEVVLEKLKRSGFTIAADEISWG